jgi:hypothetical protein
MLFDLIFPGYLTSFSGEKCLSGKVICAFVCPAYQGSPVPKNLKLLRCGLNSEAGAGMEQQRS